MATPTEGVDDPNRSQRRDPKADQWEEGFSAPHGGSDIRCVKCRRTNPYEIGCVHALFPHRVEATA
jgi:hypothetical protein